MEQVIVAVVPSCILVIVEDIVAIASAGTLIIIMLRLEPLF